MQGAFKYRAFISYSHRDAAFGRRLHRRLEGYRVPRRVVGRETALGPVARRLAPIFRDREELAAATDLTKEVEEALRRSGALVVVCSPAAAASIWVGREIEVFRSLNPTRPVLAALIEGEPYEAFPKSLSLYADAQSEPLAADFREGRDGARLALLKLVAGIIGIGLDELVQRDASRQLQRLSAIAGFGLSAAIVMGILAIAALNAQHEAEHQRAGAEGLVDFMITDLRDKLKAVGRLDLLTTVNKRALSYYADQDLTRLSADSLERRARIFHAMGEDDDTRGNDKLASAEFQEARRTTAQLLLERPNNPERIFDHAQSEYWIGYIAYEEGKIAAAKESFQIYKALADRLVAIAPNNPRFVREVGYAQTNLCALDLRPPKDAKAALVACNAAVKNMERLFRLGGDTAANEVEFANRHAWLADAFRANGDNASSLSESLTQERILASLLARDPNNVGIRLAWVGCQRTLALRDGESGQFKRARERQTSVAQMIDAMIRVDPSNTKWTDQRRRLTSDISTINQMDHKEKAR
jgi:hypothetical protein